MFSKIIKSAKHFKSKNNLNSKKINVNLEQSYVGILNSHSKTTETNHLNTGCDQKGGRYWVSRGSAWLMRRCWHTQHSGFPKQHSFFFSLSLLTSFLLTDSYIANGSPNICFGKMITVFLGILCTFGIIRFLEQARRFHSYPKSFGQRKGVLVERVSVIIHYPQWHRVACYRCYHRAACSIDETPLTRGPATGAGGEHGENLLRLLWGLFQNICQYAAGLQESQPPRNRAVADHHRRSAASVHPIYQHSRLVKCSW